MTVEKTASVDLKIQTDLIELEIFGRLFAALVENMATVVVKTSHTTFVRETQDFGTALATTDGWFFAYPRTLGSSTLLGLPFADCLRAIPAYAPGDLILTNDPFASKAGCTHVPDVTAWAPIFVDGEPLCFAWGFIHSSDIGGAVAGSIAPSFSETFQEGVRIPPMPLYRGGVLNEELKQTLLANVRIPQQLWGDIQALRAAFVIADRKLQDMAKRYGAQKLRRAMQDLLLYSEQKARKVFSEIPAGTYRFVDYMEDDTVSEVPVKIELALSVQGSSLHLDYTGTDPQVGAAYNVPTSGKVHPWVIAGLGYYIVSQDPDIPINAGFFRALSVTLPEGSLVNPVFPAAIGVRSVTGVRILEVLLGTLGQALPHRIPAAGSGVGTIVLIGVPDYRRGGHRINVIDPCVGGSGGRPIGDGFDGTDFTFGFLRNTPSEILEAESFILIRRFGFLTDSGGPGKFRGGLGVALEIQSFAPNATLIARGMERTRFDPWGVHGGYPGARMSPVVVNPGRSDERKIRKLDVLHLEPGDVVRFCSPGGGGYGNPLDRDPRLVQLDVASGFVSTPAAREVYGVELRDDGSIDEEGTVQRRTTLRRTGSQGKAGFSFGEERLRYDRIWSQEARAALQDILGQLPILMRDGVKKRIHAALNWQSRNSSISRHEVLTSWHTIRDGMHLDRYLTAGA